MKGIFGFHLPLLLLGLASLARGASEDCDVVEVNGMNYGDHNGLYRRTDEQFSNHSVYKRLSSPERYIFMGKKLSWTGMKWLIGPNIEHSYMHSSVETGENPWTSKWREPATVKCSNECAAGNENLSLKMRHFCHQGMLDELREFVEGELKEELTKTKNGLENYSVAASVNCYFYYHERKGRNQDGHDGATPLLMAVGGNHTEMVKYLLSIGAEVNMPFRIKQISNQPVKDNRLNGYSPLAWAINQMNFSRGDDHLTTKDYLSMVKLLVDHGADVNQKHKPLCREANTDVVCDNDPESILHFAIKSLKRVKEKGFQHYDHKHPAPHHELIGKDGHPGHAKEHKTELNIAGPVILELIQFLLDKGADINSKGKEEKTPLHYAVYFRLFTVIRLLINSGADMEARDGSYGKNGEGLRPLDLQAICERTDEKGRGYNFYVRKLKNGILKYLKPAKAKIVKAIIEDAKEKHYCMCYDKEMGIEEHPTFTSTGGDPCKFLKEKSD